MKDASPQPAAAHFECALRVAGRAPVAGYEVSVDGSEYRQCRLENGAWRARWEIAAPGDDPIVAVFRPCEGPVHRRDRA